MFRRRWSGLPADPVYPADMKHLGYFVNNEDEIRNIDEPDKYFKYFLSKNTRWNDRQRFAMNEAIQSLVHHRLETELKLQKLILPLGTPTDSPHVPIFVSTNIQKANRIIVIFGESAQDLGIIAHRVLGGPGGVTKGSIISVVQAIQQADVWNKLGIVIANPGELWWWPEGKRGLTLSGRFMIPMQSAVHWERGYDARLNAIPGHETVGRHVKSVFEEVLGKVVKEDAKLAVVAVTDVADEVETYLDDDERWKIWGPRMESLSLLGNFYGVTDPIKCEGFKKFLAERARNWIGDAEPLDTALANPEGTPSRPGIGCPVFSAGPDAYLAELLMIYAYPSVLKFIKDAAFTNDFRNPRYEVDESPLEPNEARYWDGYEDEDVAMQGAQTQGDQKENVVDCDNSKLPKKSDNNAAEVLKKSEQSEAKEPKTTMLIAHAYAGENEAGESHEQKDKPNPTVSKGTVARKVLAVKENVADQGDGLKQNAVPEKPSPIVETTKADNTDSAPDKKLVSPQRSDNAPVAPDNKPTTKSFESNIIKTSEKSGSSSSEAARATPTLEVPAVQHLSNPAEVKELDPQHKRKKQDAEKERLEFMRREVVHALEQVEKLVGLTLEEGVTVGDADDDDDNEQDEDLAKKDDDEDDN